MFAKLLKYEWKASAPLLGILSLAALGAGALGGLILRLSSYSASNELGEALLAATTGLSVGFIALALAVYVAATTIILLYRFYKNKFSGQGYLTFTLPVTSHEIFLSSLLMLLVWQLISVLTALASGILMLLLGDVGFGEAVTFSDIAESFAYLTDDEQDQLGLSIGLAIAQSVTGWLYGNILTMTSITLGAAWARKHKLLAAFGIYYGVSYGLSFISGIISVVVSVAGSLAENPFLSLQASSLSTIVMELLLIAGGYLLTNHMMTRKLNLS